MYSTEINGETIKFGTSGLLYRSNKLMYDRGTQSLWHQFTWEPLVGPLADSGIRLEVLPVAVITWEEWVAAHPDTTVLDINTGVYPAESYQTESDPQSIYYRYRQSPQTMFPVWQQSDILSTKSEVLGLVLKGMPKAYPLGLLLESPVTNASLGSENLVIVATDALVGGARAYEGGANVFSLVEPGKGKGRATVLADDHGRRWRMEEETLVQMDDPSQRLQRLPSRNAFWFGWFAFHPTTELYQDAAALTP